MNMALSNIAMNTKAYCEGCHYELKESEHQYCAECRESLEDYISASHNHWKSERATRFRDYEPELAYGTAHDFREHARFGGTREDY